MRFQGVKSLACENKPELASHRSRGKTAAISSTVLSNRTFFLRIQCRGSGWFNPGWSECHADLTNPDLSKWQGWSTRLIQATTLNSVRSTHQKLISEKEHLFGHAFCWALLVCLPRTTKKILIGRESINGAIFCPTLFCSNKWSKHSGFPWYPLFYSCSLRRVPPDGCGRHEAADWWRLCQGDNTGHQDPADMRNQVLCRDLSLSLLTIELCSLESQGHPPLFSSHSNSDPIVWESEADITAMSWFYGSHLKAGPNFSMMCGWKPKNVRAGQAWMEFSLWEL